MKIIKKEKNKKPKKHNKLEEEIYQNLLKYQNEYKYELEIDTSFVIIDGYEYGEESDKTYTKYFVKDTLYTPDFCIINPINNMMLVIEAKGTNQFGLISQDYPVRKKLFLSRLSENPNILFCEIKNDNKENLKDIIDRFINLQSVKIEHVFSDIRETASKSYQRDRRFENIQLTKEDNQAAKWVETITKNKYNKIALLTYIKRIGKLSYPRYLEWQNLSFDKQYSFKLSKQKKLNLTEKQLDQFKKEYKEQIELYRKIRKEKNNVK